jgi:hypothetical protein
MGLELKHRIRAAFKRPISYEELIESVRDADRLVAEGTTRSLGEVMLKREMSKKDTEPVIDTSTYELLGVANPEQAETQQLEAAFDSFVDLVMAEMPHEDYRPLVYLAVAKELGLPTTRHERDDGTETIVRVSPSRFATFYVAKYS